MTNKLSSVSIVTITQLSRHECLLNLYELIQLQIYQNIIEWVIVEGSKTEENATINKEYIHQLIKQSKEYVWMMMIIIHLKEFLMQYNV